MSRIPSTFVDDLIARIDIVDIVDSSVPLRRAGKNHVACCPFHKEKTPSFTVSPDKQFYYCFGCGANGNVIGFMMEYHHFGFVDAIESLAKRAGLQVPREAGGDNRQKRQQFQAIYDVLEDANDFYQRQLREANDKNKAVSYLKSRGLSGQIAKRFQVGFAPDGWNNLINNEALRKHPAELFVKAGLSISKNAQGDKDRALQYDRFRDRIIFPIRDQRGRTIAFGGRVFGDEKPKYLNSPETPVFTKGQELYGWYEAKQANNKLEKAVVVEGYMDVIALAQMGIDNAVATLGTAASSEHLHLLFKTVNEVIFCFDGDNAGRRAAERALNNALPLMQDGRQIRFLFLDEGEDPDTLVRKEGPEVFENMVSTSMPLSEFLFHHLGQHLDLESMDGRARLAKLATPMINQMPKGLFYEMMLERLAEITRLSKDIIQKSVSDAFTAEQEKAAERDRLNKAYAESSQKSAPTGQAKPATENHSPNKEPNKPLNQTSNDAPDFPEYEASDFGEEAFGSAHSNDSHEMPDTNYESPDFGVSDFESPGLESSGFESSGNASPTQQISTVNAILKLVIQSPQLVMDCEVPEEVYKLQASNMDLLVELFNYIRSTSNETTKVTAAMILGHWHNTQEGFLLASLAAEETLLDATHLEQQFSDALKRLIAQYFRNEIGKTQGNSQEDKTRLLKLLAEKARFKA